MKRVIAPRAREVLFVCGLQLVVACQRPAEERARRDLDVGHADNGVLGVNVPGGLAAVRVFTSDRLVLWSSAPGWELELDAREAVAFTLELRNIMPSADLTVVESAGASIDPLESELVTRKRYSLTVPAGQTKLRLGAPGALEDGAFRFALMSDVQEAIDAVDDLYLRMNEEDGVDFLLGAGDLTEGGSVEELVEFQDHLEILELPYYTTLGNHELWSKHPPYQDYFGRSSFHFVHRGVHFSMIDSGSATIDPLVYEWLDGWLAAAYDDVHVVAMHIPPLDPIGVRNGAFGNRAEGASFVAQLAQSRVDLTLYGHIHSYYSFDNAGIPAFISGGGGALPERFDNMGRHFMLIDIDPRLGLTDTRIVRVDKDY